jgi:hypothetical protein
MKIAQLSSTELLAYSTIFENIINTNLEIQREIHNAVSQGFATPKELEKILDKSVKAKEEADTLYEQIQIELDGRMKRDLNMKFGIRRSQSIIKEFDTFVDNRNSEIIREQQEQKKLAENTEGGLKKVEDDNL